MARHCLHVPLLVNKTWHCKTGQRHEVFYISEKKFHTYTYIYCLKLLSKYAKLIKTKLVLHTQMSQPASMQLGTCHKGQ